MDEKERMQAGTHRLSLAGRKQGEPTGVKEVVSFDAKEVVLDTSMGGLIIRGDDLFIRRLSVEKGEVDLDGRIDSLIYSDKSVGKHGQDSLLKRLFR